MKNEKQTKKNDDNTNHRIKLASFGFAKKACEGLRCNTLYSPDNRR